MINIGKGARVRNRENSKEYELGRPLFLGGRFSQIYRIVEINHSSDLYPQPEYIAKVGLEPNIDYDTLEKAGPEAFAPLLAGTKKHYDREIKYTKRIRRQSKGKFVPDVSQGEWMGEELSESARQVPVLLMPRMGTDDNDWLLGKQLRDGKLQPSEIEQVALCAGIEYLELLTVLKQIDLSCNDRKVGDIFWDRGNEKLYVLDWNVVDEGIVDEEKARTALRLFGRLWYELLVGKTPIGVDLDNGEQSWRDLSLGLRQLLLGVLQCGEPRGYANEGVAKQEWEKYLQLYRCRQEEMESEVAGILNSLNDDTWDENWNKLLRIRDIMRVRGFDSDRTAALDEAISKRDDHLEEMFDSACASARSHMTGGDFDKAAGGFRRIATDLKYTAEMRLAAIRQSYLAFGLSNLSEKRSIQPDEITKFVDATKFVMGERWGDKIYDLTQIYPDFDHLKILDLEHKYSKLIKELKDDKYINNNETWINKYKEGENFLKSFTDKVGVIDKEVRLYIDLVLSSVGNLPKARYDEVSVKVKQATRLKDKQDLERQTIAAVTEVVNRAVLQSPIRWPAAEVDKALIQWQEAQYDAPAIIISLLGLNVVLSKSMRLAAIDALDAFCDWHQTESSDEIMNLHAAVRVLGHKLAYEHLKDRPTLPYRPADVSKELYFASRVLNSHIGDGDHRLDIERRRKELEEIREIQNRLASSEQITDDTDQDDLYKLLQDAQSKQIECFDDDQGLTVAAMLARRRGLRIQAHLDALDSGFVDINNNLEARLYGLVTKQTEIQDKVKNVAPATGGESADLAPEEPEPASGAPTNGNGANNGSDPPLQSRLTALWQRLRPQKSNRMMWGGAAVILFAALLVLALLQMDILGRTRGVEPTPKSAASPTPMPTLSVSIDTLKMIDLPPKLVADGGQIQAILEAEDRTIGNLEVTLASRPADVLTFTPNPVKLSEGKAQVTIGSPTDAGGSVEVIASYRGQSHILGRTEFVVVPQLAIEIAVEPATNEVNAGGVLTYTASVINKGKTDARGIEVQCSTQQQWLGETDNTTERKTEISRSVPPDSVLAPGESTMMNFNYWVPIELQAGTELPVVKCVVTAKDLKEKIEKQGSKFTVAEVKPVFEQMNVTPVQVAVGETVTISARVTQGGNPVARDTVIKIIIGSESITSTVAEDGRIEYEYPVPASQVGSRVPITLSIQDSQATMELVEVFPVIEATKGAILRKRPDTSDSSKIRETAAGEKFRLLAQTSGEENFLWLCCNSDGQTVWLNTRVVQNGQYAQAPRVMQSLSQSVVYASHQGASGNDNEDILVNNLEDGTYLRVIEELNDRILHVRLYAWVSRDRVTSTNNKITTTSGTSIWVVVDQSLSPTPLETAPQTMGPAVENVWLPVVKVLADDLIQIVIDGYMPQSERVQ